MERITLTNEQINVIAQAHGPVAMHDEAGRLRGYIALVVTGDEFAEAQRVLASPQRRFTTAEVLSAFCEYG